MSGAAASLRGRLDAAPQGADSGEAAPATYAGACLDCGAAYESAMAHSEFCSPACRRRWNNRRARRGAAVYDLFMATRYQRELVGPLKLWRALNRLAAQFRLEDRRARGGRRSWTPPREVLLRRPWLNAIHHAVRAGRRN